ncbi:MAG: helix-turn-helix domain-containing protein [Nocardioides sp.]|uniref:helix-turn-helix domain-containing protein n=1 Tax=Nocardioides sp. TaxID=35761 RepID=UPI003F0155FB
MIATDAHQLGLLVKDARRSNGMSQADLASLIGVTRQWVIAFEAGSPTSQVGLVIKALQAVGLEIDAVEVDKDPFTEVFRG